MKAHEFTVMVDSAPIQSEGGGAGSGALTLEIEQGMH
jgi:hypothetical protein